MKKQSYQEHPVAVPTVRESDIFLLEEEAPAPRDYSGFVELGIGILLVLTTSIVALLPMLIAASELVYPFNMLAILGVGSSELWLAWFALRVYFLSEELKALKGRE
jgi:hypothetical protein